MRRQKACRRCVGRSFFVHKKHKRAQKGAPPGLKFHCLHSGVRGASHLANQGTPLRGFLSASLRSAEFGRAADAAQARASPASLTDGEDAVGTSRAPARRTSSPIVGVPWEGAVGTSRASARRTSGQSWGAAVGTSRASLLGQSGHEPFSSYLIPKTILIQLF